MAREERVYKAIVTDKQDGERLIIASKHTTKGEFIQELRRNGYRVNPLKVQLEDVFNHVMDNTNCGPEDWRRGMGGE